MVTQLNADNSIDNAQQWMKERLTRVVESEVEHRRQHWAAVENPRPAANDVRRLIRDASRRNAAVAGTMTLVPGPLSVATIPAELFLTVRNNVNLVYDIAVAHGKEHLLDTELLVSLALEDTNRGILGLVFVENETRIQRPQRRLLGKVATLASRTLAKRLLRLAFGRIVPVVGAAGAALWTRSNTLAVGQRADALIRNRMTVEHLDEAATVALEAELDRRISTPDELILSEELAVAVHQVFGNLVRNQSPSEAQRERFAALVEVWNRSGASVDDLDFVLARDEDYGVNLPALSQLPVDELLADLAAFGELGAGVPPSWLAKLGLDLGVPLETIDDLLRS